MFLIPKVFLAIILFIISGSVYSHDLFLEKSNGSYIIRYGHPVPDEHGGEKHIVYRPEIIKKIYCLSNGVKKEIPFQIRYPVTFQADCAGIFISTSSGIWTKTATGTKNLPPEKTSNPLTSWESFESLKVLIHPSQSIVTPATEELEMVVENPHLLRSGDRFFIYVYYKNKVLSDIPVARAGETRGQTDGQGKIRLTIKNRGLQIFTATYKIKGENGMDQIITSSIQFEVP